MTGHRSRRERKGGWWRLERGAARQAVNSSGFVEHEAAGRHYVIDRRQPAGLASRARLCHCLTVASVGLGRWCWGCVGRLAVVAAVLNITQLVRDMCK